VLTLTAHSCCAQAFIVSVLAVLLMYTEKLVLRNHPLFLISVSMCLYMKKLPLYTRLLCSKEKETFAFDVTAAVNLDNSK
jgi:hypothetical protein